MKKISLSCFLALITLLSIGQNPITKPPGTPNYTFSGNETTMQQYMGYWKAKKGLINGIYTDTTQANLGFIDAYAGAQIFTTTDNTIWLRNSTATKWISISIDITSFTFDNDTTGIICFGNGVCDTFRIVNFTTIIQDIIQNFNDSTIRKINDTTLLYCPSPNSCDTIHLGNTNDFFITYDSTSNNFYIVTCDTVQFICLTGTSIGDSCYQQQVCDSILIPQPPITFYQNLLWKNGPLVEVGDPLFGTSAQLRHDTYFNLGGYHLNMEGASFGPPVTFRNFQWSQISSSITSWNHNGAYPPALLDQNNPVKLYMNYTDPFVVPSNGALMGDTVGFMGDRYGYMFITNSKGYTYGYQLDDINAKQVGVFFDTYSPNDEAVSIFGNKHPSGYALSNNNAPDTTLLDSRIAVFKTNKQVQLPGYDSTQTFITQTPTTIAGWDSEGNFVQIDTLGIGGRVTILNDTTIIICSFGTNLCDTIYTTVGIHRIYANNGLTALNDSTVQLGSTTNSGSPLLHDTYINTDAYVLNISNISTGVTANKKVLQVLNSGATFNTTGGNLTSFLSYFNNTATKSAGANNLTNIGVYSTATGGDINYAAYFDGSVLADVSASTSSLVRITGSAAHSTVLTVQDLSAVDLFRVKGSGELRSGRYGIGSFTSGTGTYLLAVQADGDIMEFPTGGLPGGGNLITADQGVKANTSTNVRLGGDNDSEVPFSSNRFVNTSTNYLSVKGSGSLVLYVYNTTANTAGYFQSTGGTSVIAEQGSVGVNASGSTIGVSAGSDSGLPLWMTSNDAGTNDIKRMTLVTRTTTGSVAAGFGASHDFQLETTGSTLTSNRIISKWFNTGDLTAISQLDIIGLNAASPTTIMSAYGSGVVGIGISSSYTATRLEVVDNAVGAASIMKLTSTSTAAASNLQVGMEVLLSGTNGTASQTTKGISSVNSHDGTNARNYGVYGEVQNGLSSSAGIRGVATSQKGVYGEATSGTGVQGDATSGIGVLGSVTNGVGAYGAATSGTGFQGTSDSGLPGLFQAAPTSTNTIVELLRLTRVVSSGNGADGVGGYLSFFNEADNGIATLANAINSKWATAAQATRTSQLIFQGVTSATTQDWLILGQSGYLKLRPMTVTEAGAIATAEGLLVFVSNTDATFTSIGPWMYYNGAWHAL